MDNFLKPLNNKIIYKNLFGFDIETYGEDNKFLMGSIVNDKNTFVFWDRNMMQEYIIKNMKNCIIFATNLGFDFLSLFGNDFKILSQFDYTIKGSDFIIIKHKRFSFYDTMSFFKASVEKLGEIVGIEKLEKPSFLGERVTKNSNKGKILEKYNIRDSLITFKFADFLQKSFNKYGCNMKCTLASTSMHLFRNRYLKHWIKQPEKKILIDCFKGFYGGRCETFYRGKIPENKFYLYDINSLYPYMMNIKNYPNTNTLKNGINLEKEGMTRCKIHCPDMFYPFLPFRTKEKLLFPTGNFEGWYTNAELRKSIDLGYDIIPIEGYYCESNFNPFNDFINELYSERLRLKNIGSPIELPIKIIMNSLFGKFSQKLYYQEILFADNKKNIDKISEYCKINRNLENAGKDIRYEIDSVGNIDDIPKIYYIKDFDNISYPKFINPMIASYITSYARMELYSYFEKIISNNHKVLYCDTDSLITDMELHTSTKLGDMKKEIDIKKGILIKPKFYYLENDDNIFVKSKGCHNLNSINQFKEVLENRTYEYVKFTKFKEAMRRNIHFNKKINIIKYLDFEDNKRLWKNLFDENILEKSNPIIVS